MRIKAKFEKVSFEQYAKDFELEGNVQEIYDAIKLPKRATKYPAGYDFYAPITITLQPNETIKIPTGIRVQMEDEFVLILCPRSGLGFKFRLQLNNTIGVIDSDYYYGDPYNSLCTKYDPYNCRCTGDMILGDVKQKKYIHLIADTDGYMSSQIYKVDDLPKQYKTMDDTNEFKNYFIELINAVNVEKRRLLSILDDTRNYQCRTSARLIGDHISIFTEEFNYSIPEMNEYYVLIRTNGKYRLEVFDRSAFMHFYLFPEDLKKYYGDDELVPKEEYQSIEQIDELIAKENSSGDMARYRMRKRAFSRLQPKVDELYEALKEDKVFIQNLDFIYDNPAETLSYYKIEKDFECVYDEEYGEIYDSLKEKLYTLPNGVEVTVTLDDIYSAFKYGYPSIEEICRIKAIYGSVHAVFK